MTAKKQTQKKVQYFNSQAFVDKVLEDCQLGDVSAQERSELEEQVERRLSERITATVINGMTERDMQLYEKVLADHPELDDMDALTVIASNLPDLQMKLLKSIQDLYEELTYDAQQIQMAMDRRVQAEQAAI